MPCSSEITSQNWKTKIAKYECFEPKITHIYDRGTPYLGADLVSALSGLKMYDFAHFDKLFSEQIKLLLSLLSWVCGMVVRRDGAVFIAWNNLCDNFRETIGLFPFTVNGGDVMYRKRWILLIVYWWLVEMNRHNATPDNLCPKDKALRPKANQGPRIITMRSRSFEKKRYIWM